MIFIIILVIVFVVIYNKKKSKEQEEARAENIMQGSKFQPIDNSFPINNADNPFFDNSNSGTNVNNSLDYQNNAQESFNPFTDNNNQSNLTANDVLTDKEFTFPVCPIDDSNIIASNKKIIRTLKYNYTDFVAFSYDYYGKKLLLFQKVSVENDKMTHSIVEYGYCWLKLFYILKKYVLFNDDFDNTKEMPQISETELDKMFVKDFLRDLPQEKTFIEFTYNDGHKKAYYKFGTVEYENYQYAFLVAEDNIEDIEIDRVSYKNDGSASYEEVTDNSLESILWDLYSSTYENN